MRVCAANEEGVCCTNRQKNIKTRVNEAQPFPEACWLDHF